MEDVRASAFAAVLGDVAFPLRRAEIAAAADDHGVDPLTRRKIDQLPDRPYTDVFDIVVALSSTPVHLSGRRPL